MSKRAELQSAVADLESILGRLTEDVAVLRLYPDAPYHGRYVGTPGGPFRIVTADHDSAEWARSTLQNRPALTFQVVERFTAEEVEGKLRETWGRVLPAVPLPKKYRK